MKMKSRFGRPFRRLITSGLLRRSQHGTIVSGLMLAVVCIASGSAQASTIAQAELSASAAALTLDAGPVVSAVLSTPGTNNGVTTTRYIFLVDDGTGSMDVFGPASVPLAGGYVPAAGDDLTISGPFSPFSGIPEMGTPTAIAKNSSGNPVPAPLIETIPTLATYTTAPPAAGGTAYPSFAGHLVTLQNVSISSAISGSYGTASVTSTITDSASHTLAGFYQPGTYALANQNLFGTSIARSGVDVTGIIQIFGGAPEMLIMSVTQVPEPATCALLGLGALVCVSTRNVSGRARKR